MSLRVFFPGLDGRFRVIIGSSSLRFHVDTESVPIFLFSRRSLPFFKFGQLFRVIFFYEQKFLECVDLVVVVFLHFSHLKCYKFGVVQNTIVSPTEFSHHPEKPKSAHWTVLSLFVLQVRFIHFLHGL